MLPENSAFFIRGEDGNEYGPVDLDELRDWVQENRAGLGTEVRRDDPGAQWSPWQNHPELVALLAEVQVSSPVPGVPGVAFAPLGRRMAAFVVDLILLSIPTVIIFYTLIIISFPDWVARDVVAFNQFMADIEAGNQHPFTPPEPPEHALLMAEIVRDSILALYFTGFIAAHGKTPGKALFRLQVVDALGRKPDLAKSFFRAMILIFSICLLFIPLAYVFINPQRRAFHDMIADTYVVEA